MIAHGAAGEPAMMRRDAQKDGRNLLEVHPHNEQEPTEAPEEPRISCGGHTATRCRLCTVIDPDSGLETPDRGPDWCHGDCTYYDGECHTLTSYNLHVARDNSTEGASTSMPVPDILNPNITDFDRELMDAAAK